MGKPLKHTPVSLIDPIARSAASIFFQTFLFGLTAYKFVGAVRTGWREIPLLVLLMRDGTWAFLVIFGIYSIIFYPTLHNTYNIPSNTHSTGEFIWPKKPRPCGRTLWVR